VELSACTFSLRVRLCLPLRSDRFFMISAFIVLRTDILDFKQVWRTIAYIRLIYKAYIRLICKAYVRLIYKAYVRLIYKAYVRLIYKAYVRLM